MALLYSHFIIEKPEALSGEVTLLIVSGKLGLESPSEPKQQGSRVLPVNGYALLNTWHTILAWHFTNLSCLQALLRFFLKSTICFRTTMRLLNVHARSRRYIKNSENMLHSLTMLRISLLSRDLPRWLGPRVHSFIHLFLQQMLIIECLLHLKHCDGWWNSLLADTQSIKDAF